MPAFKRRKKSKPKDNAVKRLGDLLAAGHGTEKDAELYFKIVDTQCLRKIKESISLAEAQRNWSHLKGATIFASEIYTLAAIMYEKYNNPIMSDGAFDGLARFLLPLMDSTPKKFKEWYNISSMLGAGTSLGIVETPTITRYVNLLLNENTHSIRFRRKRRLKIANKK